MRFTLIAEEIHKYPTIWQLKQAIGSELNFYESGDTIIDVDMCSGGTPATQPSAYGSVPKTYVLEEIKYVTNVDDDHYGVILFLGESYLKIKGVIEVVTIVRFKEVIEAMRELISGEVSYDELFTSSEEWKRDIFKHIYGEQ